MIKILCFVIPCYGKARKIKNVNQLILRNVQNNVFDSPSILTEYNLFSQNTESSLEQ